MSYEIELRKSKDKPQVAFHEFMLSTGKFSNHVFCFFEGKDNAYYVPRIKRFTDKYQPIKCGGREKVLDVYRLINNRREYDRYKKAYFIDRDFNQPLSTNNLSIFETPCYSIENLYVSISVFKEILKNEFHLSETSDSNFQACETVFLQRQREFHDAICLFNSWYCCLIDLKSQTGTNTGANLDDKLPKDFIDFSLQSIKLNYDLEKIEQTFPNSLKVTQAALQMKLVLFSQCEYHKVFRGKYEMQFLLKIIQLLLKDSLTEKSILKAKVNFAFGDGSGLNNEQAINILEGYAETPNSLLEYLERVC